MMWLPPSHIVPAIDICFGGTGETGRVIQYIIPAYLFIPAHAGVIPALFPHIGIGVLIPAHAGLILSVPQPATLTLILTL